MQNSILSLYYYDYQGRNVFLLLYMEKACNAITFKNIFMLNTNMSRNTALSLLQLRFYVALAGLILGTFSLSSLYIYVRNKH